MICAHCNKDPGYKENQMWNGFRDGDTKEYCCWSCREIHYMKKNKHLNFVAGAMTYSEFPVMNPNYQLTLKL